MAVNPATVYYPSKDAWGRLSLEQAGFDPEHDLVAVLRWIDKERVDEVYGKILHALTVNA